MADSAEGVGSHALSVNAAPVPGMPDDGEPPTNPGGFPVIPSQPLGSALETRVAQPVSAGEVRQVTQHHSFEQVAARLGTSVGGTITLGSLLERTRTAAVARAAGQTPKKFNKGFGAGLQELFRKPKKPILAGMLATSRTVDQSFRSEVLTFDTKIVKIPEPTSGKRRKHVLVAAMVPGEVEAGREGNGPNEVQFMIAAVRAQRHLVPGRGLLMHGRHQEKQAIKEMERAGFTQKTEGIANAVVKDVPTGAVREIGALSESLSATKPDVYRLGRDYRGKLQLRGISSPGNAAETSRPISATEFMTNSAAIDGLSSLDHRILSAAEVLGEKPHAIARAVVDNPRLHSILSAPYGQAIGEQGGSEPSREQAHGWVLAQVEALRQNPESLTGNARAETLAAAGLYANHNSERVPQNVLSTVLFNISGEEPSWRHPILRFAHDRLLRSGGPALGKQMDRVLRPQGFLKRFWEGFAHKSSNEKYTLDRLLTNLGYDPNPGPDRPPVQPNPTQIYVDRVAQSVRRRVEDLVAVPNFLVKAAVVIGGKTIEGIFVDFPKTKTAHALAFLPKHAGIAVRELVWEGIFRQGKKQEPHKLSTS